jgi:hypothetical protein
MEFRKVVYTFLVRLLAFVCQHFPFDDFNTLHHIRLGIHLLGEGVNAEIASGTVIVLASLVDLAVVVVEEFRLRVLA